MKKDVKGHEYLQKAYEKSLLLLIDSSVDLFNRNGVWCGGTDKRDSRRAGI